MKKGNRKIMLGLLGIFLLLVGMYVYHMNILKEGFDQSQSGMTREQVNMTREQLKLTGEQLDAHKAKYPETHKYLGGDGSPQPGEGYIWTSPSDGGPARWMSPAEQRLDLGLPADPNDDSGTVAETTGTAIKDPLSSVSEYYVWPGEKPQKGPGRGVWADDPNHGGVWTNSPNDPTIGKPPSGDTPADVYGEWA